MKLTIIAATGGVGRHLLRQALDAGHDVTAVARNPAKLPSEVAAGAAARAATADLANPGPQALESAVAGADAVLSAPGPHTNADAGIAAPGTAAIITAMRTAGVRRIVAISASPVATTPSPGRPDPPRHDPGDGSSCGMSACGPPRRCSARSTTTSPRWKTCCATPACTGPSCGRHGSPASRPPSTTAPRPGTTSAAAGPSPRADLAHHMLA